MAPIVKRTHVLRRLENSIVNFLGRSQVSRMTGKLWNAGRKPADRFLPPVEMTQEIMQGF